MDQSNGLRFASLYPAEGDTAIAELLHGDEMWGDLRLKHIDLTAVGTARTVAATSCLRLFPPPKGSSHWEFDLSEVNDIPRRAHSWLIQNEQGRTPEAH